MNQREEEEGKDNELNEWWRTARTEEKLQHEMGGGRSGAMTSCEGSLPPGDIPGRDDNNHSHTGNVPAVSCESDETHAAGSLGERTAERTTP